MPRPNRQLPLRYSGPLSHRMAKGVPCQPMICLSVRITRSDLWFQPKPRTLRRYRKHRPKPQLRWLSVRRSSQLEISSFSASALATYR